jgi:hypothetical protein
MHTQISGYTKKGNLKLVYAFGGGDVGFKE